MNTTKRQIYAIWLCRSAVGFVLAMNIACALSFIFEPEAYSAAFEITGVPGKVVVQGFGILFVMWNVTYPPVLAHPNAQRTLFVIILIQQAIGVVGETWIWLELPPGHSSLYATGLRFIVFDGIGFLLMGVAYWVLRIFDSSYTLPAGNAIVE